MTEQTKIEKALELIDNAKQIYKGMTKGVADLKDLEIRSNFIELKSALLDSQEAMLSLKEEFDAKNQEIKNLKTALKLKEDIILFEHHGHYHKKDENGEPIGVPYCSRCWEVEHKLVSISNKQNCPECDAKLWRAVPLKKREVDKENA